MRSFPRIVGVVLAGFMLLALTGVASISCANSSNNGTSTASSSDGGSKPAGSKGQKTNEGAFEPAGVAATKELSMTLESVSDSYRTGHEFVQPKSGNRFVVVHVTAQNVDKREHSVNQFSFKLKTVDKHVYDPTVGVGDGGFGATQLGAGELAEGDVAFEIPQGARVAELKYDTGLGADDLFWHPR